VLLIGSTETYLSLRKLYWKMISKCVRGQTNSVNCLYGGDDDGCTRFRISSSVHLNENHFVLLFTSFCLGAYLFVDWSVFSNGFKLKFPCIGIGLVDVMRNSVVDLFPESCLYVFSKLPNLYCAVYIIQRKNIIFLKCFDYWVL
jgi:hypothetical protein